MTALVPIVNQDEESGIELYDYLNRPGTREQLKNKRLFYIIKANSESVGNKKDPAVFKFGIAGTDSGNGIGRLQSYVRTYGRQSNLNPCSGVKLFFLGSTQYKQGGVWEMTPGTRTKIYQIEKRIKDILRAEKKRGSKYALVEGRGAERTSVGLRRLKNLVMGRGAEQINDSPVTMRRTGRQRTKLQSVPNDYVGRFVKKKFDGEFFKGRVEAITTGPDPRIMYAKVVYTDGDVDLMDLQELRRYLV